LSPLKQQRQHKPHNNKPHNKHSNTQCPIKYPNSNNAFSLLAAAAL
jgi:hypothetical protein